MSTTLITPGTFPMPNATIDDRTVVASVWLRDDDQFQEALVLLLGPASPFFRVAVVDVATSNIIGVIGDHYNIVEAVGCYESNGGDI